MNNSKKPKGKLIIIGGRENRDGNPKILEEVAKEATRKKGSLVIVTVATPAPEEVDQEYTEVFQKIRGKEDRTPGHPVAKENEREQA